MAVWDDLLTDIYTLTARPDLTNESAIALRQATRAAHKSGKYWRDLVKVTIAADPTLQIQQLDLSLNTTLFRQAATLRSTAIETLWYSPITVEDVLDPDGYARTNVFWGMGTLINIRAANPESSYDLVYYQYPNVTAAGYNSWIADQHKDLIVIMAAMTVLSTIGESEIRQNLSQLLALEMADFKQDALEIVGR